ncbi:MAG: xanthine dehydrogenase family protein molybdopterin-binding subunit [Deltaproteobacteria bacterium]|nr:xanthine dehydrogenase family protein molybdopterin-binding subunit [Deltaproteobacteria bacterium]
MKNDQQQAHQRENLVAPSLDCDRREFLKKVGILGGGIIVYCTIGDTSESAAQMPGGPPADFNTFVRIGADERVTGYVGKVDMGQGTITSFTQIVAEELDVAYDSVDIIMGDTDLCPWDFGTGGSMSISVHAVQVRNAVSEARGVLKELAADYLKCPVNNLLTKNGVVFDKNNPDKKVTYGTLTKGKIIEKHLEVKPPPKSPSEFTIMGKSYLHKDAFDKVTGRTKYAGDIRLPGMQYASILRPPAHGAKLKSVDLSQARKMEGIHVIQKDDLIAVLHKNPDEAEKARRAIKAEHDMPKTGLNDENIYNHLLKIPVQPRVKERKGDIEEGSKIAKEVFEETYLSPYVAHAPMETHTSVANMENGKLTVWASTQSPFTIQNRIAQALNIPSEKVRIITPFVGGAFGGKLTMGENANPEAIEAARLTELTGKPVQVAFTRPEEFFYDNFRPATIIKIKSGLDSSGHIVLWQYDVYMAGDRCAEILYDVPHHSVNVFGNFMMPPPGAHPLRVGPWRAPGAPNNIHAKELQMNIMAAKAGIDPLEFRLKHLKNERMIGVLKAVANQFGYTPSKLPSGRGYGISCAIDAGTYVVHMGEVEVDKSSGEIRVKRIVCAYDPGLCVNPQGTKLQIEGACIMGMGYALTEGIRFSDGIVHDRNFDTYHIPRFSWVPKIETIILKNDHLPSQGAGEPAVVGIGAIIATGVHDATGAKLCNMPMTPQRVKEALAKV